MSRGNAVASIMLFHETTFYLEDIALNTKAERFEWNILASCIVGGFIKWWIIAFCWKVESVLVRFKMFAREVRDLLSASMSDSGTCILHKHHYTVEYTVFKENKDDGVIYKR